MRAIGIDLGTTNSVAAIGGADVKVLPTRAGENLTPSVVSLTKRLRSSDSEIVVGRQALNNAAREPLNTIFSIKRLMGRVYEEKAVEEVRRRFSFRLAETPPKDDPDQGVKVILGNQSYTPVDISAMILRQIREDAELALGEPVTHAVISVPAYFEERQRSATSEACERAKMKLIRLIDEPTASAIAFGIRLEDERHRVLVYDLGGGTFDISIIQMTKGQYSVLEIAGNNWLGGDDFDHIVVKQILEWVKAEYGQDLSGDQLILSTLKEEAQRAKISLSTQQIARISKTFYNTSAGTVDIDMEVTREPFEEAIRPWVDETIELVHQALRSQSLTPEDITAVLMVGGSTAIPLVHQKVCDMFGRHKVKRHVNPMECVALGAAILAAHAPLDEKGPEVEGEGPRVHERTAMDLGIAAVKGSDPDAFVPIILKGTHYPLVEPKRRIFYPTEDNQRLIRVPVYEGTSKKASLNEQQGIIEFPLPDGIASSTPVEVSFDYDRNRKLTVGIRVVGTDLHMQETLQRNRPRVHPGANPQTLLDDWREDLQPAVRTGKHFLEGYNDYMTDDDRSELESAIQLGEQALREGNQIAGKRASLLLQNKIMGSGTASQLFIAERAMHAAPPEVTYALAEAVSALRRAYHRKDKSEMERLSAELRLAVARLAAQRARIAGIEDRQDLAKEGRLRVRD